MSGLQRLPLSGLPPGAVACSQLLLRLAAGADSVPGAAAAALSGHTPGSATASTAAGYSGAPPTAPARSCGLAASSGLLPSGANAHGSVCSSSSTRVLRSLTTGGSRGGDVGSSTGQGWSGGRGGWRWARWSGGAGGGGAARGGGAAAMAGAAAAALAAAVGVGAASGVTSALAEAPSQPLREALAAVEASLRSAWAEVEEEFARINARLPAHAQSLKGEPPGAGLVHDALEVVVPLREGADTQAVLQELREGFGGRGTVSYSESVYGASRAMQLEVRPDPARPESAVRMQMFVPPPGGSEQAQVVVSKRAAFTPGELAALARLVRAANTTFAPDRPAHGDRARRHGLHGGADPDALQREMEAVVEELARSAFGGLIAGPMRQMFEEFRRGMAGPGGGGGGDGGGGNGGAFGDVFPPRQQAPGPGFGGPFGPEFGGGDGDGDGQFPGLPGAAPPAVVRRPKGGGAAAAGHDWGSPAAARAVEQLLSMGAQVFPPGSKDKMDWGVLAGYEEQKRTIEDCLLLPLLRPDVYAKLARATRKTFASNRPRAVLFEGPPGTGKTTSARVISSQAAVPLIYLPLEAVLSKWYGQSEQQLGAVFKAAEAMGGAIIFLDELDALGGNREGGLHEVSRRLLSVLLREMEGFDSETKRTVVIGATNRKADLDPALLSRFDLVLTFGLPDEDCRRLILRQYAQQLSEAELAALAGRTEGMSGRDLRDVCEHTERRWASKIIRGEVREDALPPLSEYLASAEERAAAVQRVQQQAAAAGVLSRMLGGGGGGGGGRGLPSWLGGGRQD